MSENKETQITSISQTRTIEEIGEFWDTHSLDDYWDKTREVEFEMMVKPRNRIALEPDIYEQLKREAHRRGVVPETLVNLWLAEKLKA